MTLYDVWMVAAVVITSGYALLVAGFVSRKLWSYWKDRSAYVAWVRVESIIGAPEYQWETVRQAIMESGYPEFCKVIAKREPETVALAMAMAAIHKNLSRRSKWWRAYKLKLPTLDTTKVVADIEAEFSILRAENVSIKRDLAAHRQHNHTMLAELQDIENIALFLAQEHASEKGQERLPYYGADLDAVRLRMGTIPKSRAVSVDDLLIDASQMLKWGEQLQATGIEPPPAYFSLKQHLAAIPMRKPL